MPLQSFQHIGIIERIAPRSEHCEQSCISRVFGVDDFIKPGDYLKPGLV